MHLSTTQVREQFLLQAVGSTPVIITLFGGERAQFDQQLAAGTIMARQIWNHTYNVNVTGAHIMTETFVPLLLESSDPRLLFIASGTSSLTTTESTAFPVNKPLPKGWPKSFANTDVPAYRSSKTAMNMMMREWHRFLQEDGVKVWGISPGYLATGLGPGQEVNKKQGAIDPAIGANFVRDVLEGTRDADLG
ncbi:unnamed protein product [Clonostachys rhizophaga]|uniref:Uncharacterized protein n=1 Tax=Clonostachys rhizophaga TaxID=160324 RepID=A0A9N9VUX4_9HYPO|nr:unnamed protein product [Clonostachys rhizophaga]